jgi:methylglyoxal reductase
VFGEGDHRCRKRWFTPDALAIVTTGLEELRVQIGPTTAHVVRIALWSCLRRYEHAAVLVGFTSPDQIKMNLTCLELTPTDEEVAVAREIMARVQVQLDASGAVFLDERTVEVAP